jgi:hypothetical protein
MHFQDAGPADAGIDAGMDAGRPRGFDPDAGWQVAIPLPTDAGSSTHYGVSTSLALDHYGQPMIAALVIDPNGDGVFQDSRLVFTRWNGMTRAYDDPTTVEIVGNIDVSHPNRQVSLARSEAGRIAIAYVKEGGSLRYAYSDDEGANFSLETVSGAAMVSNPVLAFAGETAHLAFNAQHACTSGMGTCAAVTHASRAASAMAFTTDAVAGGQEANDWPIAMALDSAGIPGVAFFTNDGMGNTVLSYTAAGSSQMVATSAAVFDSMVKIPSVSLNLQDDVPRLAFHLLSATDADAQLWYAQKKGGAWGTPVSLPRNGPAGMMDGTQWYQGVVSEGGDKVAVVAYFSHTGAALQQCGGPKLYHSTDGVTFPMPCNPPDGRPPGSSVLQQAGLFINLTEHAPGKVTIALEYFETHNPSIGGGVLVYRQQ